MRCIPPDYKPCVFAPGANPSPSKGGQNFANYYLLAVNDSLQVVDGSIEKKEPCFINTTVDELLNDTQAEQFPCSAK
jgi:hypothetical protein